MSDILCVTNRSLCQGDFLKRIEKIALCRPTGIILREKDMTEDGYRELAGQVMAICAKGNVPCILHSFAGVGIRLGCPNIHMSMPGLRSMSPDERSRFKLIGASCHSAEEAVEAERLGCGYVTVGHVFETDCKKGLAPRGVDFLRDVCRSVSIPVFAIGGIDGGNIAAVRSAGARGACVMSGLMTCKSPGELMAELERG